VKIKLLKDATIHGIRSKADRVHEVVDHVALKLIKRGYAALYEPKVEPEQEEEDAAVDSE
jgi:hypothetical protein